MSDGMAYINKSKNYKVRFLFFIFPLGIHIKKKVEKVQVEKEVNRRKVMTG